MLKIKFRPDCFLSRYDCLRALMNDGQRHTMLILLSYKLQGAFSLGELKALIPNFDISNFWILAPHMHLTQSFAYTEDTSWYFKSTMFSQDGSWSRLFIHYLIKLVLLNLVTTARSRVDIYPGLVSPPHE